MSTTARRAIFYSLFLAFLLIGSLVTLYAMGYHLDWDNLSPAKVGGLYVHSSPADVAIELNGETIKNKSGLFSNGTFVGGLPPRSYRLTLSAPLYRTWQRDIAVAPALVTEIKHALLIPEIIPEVYPSGAEHFWPIGKGLAISDSKIGLRLGSSTLPGGEILDWTQDGRVILTRENANYYWFDAKSGTSTTLNPIFTKNTLLKIKNVSLDKESGQIIMRTTDSIATLDVPSRTMETIATSSKNTELPNITSSRYWLAWSVYENKTNSSRIVLYDKLLKNKTVLAEKMVGRVVQMDWSADEILGILDERGEFFTYSPGADKPTHIASDGRFFVFSRNSERVAIFENRSLEIFTFQQKDEYWRFNIPNSADIKKAWWHEDMWHIVFTYPGKTVILDLEDKALQNLETLAETDNAIFQSETGFLYYGRSGNVYRLELGKG